MHHHAEGQQQNQAPKQTKSSTQYSIDGPKSDHRNDLLHECRNQTCYKNTDNEDDAVVGSEDLQIDSSEMYEDETDGKPYEMGKRGMKASRARASFIPTPQENEILNNLFGQYGEDIPPL